jgi:hypothetical protein
MKVAIMQPYLFPYLGYFQLISAVDAFVVYDDVNYINRGWINRNNILSGGRARLLTMALEQASQNKLINEIKVVGENEKLLRTISQSYTKAPYFKKVFPMIQDILMQNEKNLTKYLDYQLQKICVYLGLDPIWLISSSLNKSTSLRAQEKIIAICEELGATHYVNGIGGAKLYERQSFEEREIELSFLKQLPAEYPQFSHGFVPNLSIIDVMMFNSKNFIQSNLLNKFELEKN